MKIAIDCRYLSHGETGRLLESILLHLNFFENTYFLIGKKDNIERYQGAYYVYDDTNPNDINKMFKISAKTVNMCDAFFTPSFIVPKGIRCRVISIIPNMMWYEHSELLKSKLDLFHKHSIIRRCLKHSYKVITMTYYMKNVIIKYFGKNIGQKVIVRKPGVSFKLKENFDNSNKKGYVMYTGNFKKMSGIETILEAMTSLKNLDLLILGRRNKFKSDRPDLVKYLDYPNITFTDTISNKELITKIQQAKFLVIPSLYAGFSMSALEALNLGTKVIISDIETYKEMFKDAPVDFFKSGDSKDLINSLIVASPSFKLNEDFNEEYNGQAFADSILSELERK